MGIKISDLKMKFWDGRQISGIDEPKDPDGKVMEQVGVRFADGKEPKQEVMHRDEYEAMLAEDTKDVKDRAMHFQQAMYGVQQKIMKNLELHNVRWNEIGRVFERINDAIRETRNSMFNFLLGTENFQTEATYAHLEDGMKRYGKELDLSEFSDIEKALFVFLKEHKVKLAESQRLFQTFLPKIDGLQGQLVGAGVGTDFSKLRIDDVIAFIERETAKVKSEVSPAEPPKDGAVEDKPKEETPKV